MRRRLLGFALNWPLGLNAVVIALDVTLGLCGFGWHLLLWYLSGVCFGRALWEWCNRELRL